MRAVLLDSADRQQSNVDQLKSLLGLLPSQLAEVNRIHRFTAFSNV